MNFRGPSDPSYWTRGSVPDTNNAVPIDDELNDVDQLLADDRVARALIAASPSTMQFGDWEVYDFTEMALRSNGDVPIARWATMGYWRTKQFSLLYAISIRCRSPSCAVQTICRPVLSSPQGWQFLLILDLEHQARVTAVAIAPSKTKAKEAVAQRAILSAKLGVWLDSYHSQTKCNDYLKVVIACRVLYGRLFL